MLYFAFEILDTCLHTNARRAESKKAIAAAMAAGSVVVQ